MKKKKSSQAHVSLIDYEALKNDIAAEVRQMREEKGITQEGLAKAKELNVHYTRISAIERGCSLPSIPTLLGISAALEINTEESLHRFFHNWKKYIIKPEAAQVQQNASDIVNGDASSQVDAQKPTTSFGPKQP